MTINGRKVKLKKNIRRLIAGLQVTALIAVMTYCFAILFLWTVGIEVH